MYLAYRLKKTRREIGEMSPQEIIEWLVFFRDYDPDFEIEKRYDYRFGVLIAAIKNTMPRERAATAEENMMFPQHAPKATQKLTRSRAAEIELKFRNWCCSYNRM